MSDFLSGEDAFAAILDEQTQIQAAHTAQDAFARLFRATLDENPEQRSVTLTETARLLSSWTHGGQAQGQAAHARLALVLAALDQWGLAYSQAFGMVTTVLLTDLLGVLRNDLSVETEAACQRWYEAIDAQEANAFAFKVALRRGIHLALWHAMIASENKDDAYAVLQALGGLMVSLHHLMPQAGWRLLADTLAHIQIRCLSHGLAASGLAQESTQDFLAAIRRELPAEVSDAAFAHATQALLAWQAARRNVQ
jgi:hypothetical protein